MPTFESWNPHRMRSRVSSKADADDSAMSLSRASGSTSRSLLKGSRHNLRRALSSVAALDEVEEALPERREARASPAALLGSKRIGLVALHDDLDASLQSQVSNADTYALREAYLALQTHLYPPTQKGKQKQTTSSRYKQKLESTPSLALAKATTQLPGQYAVLVNVFRELETRLGPGWCRGEVLEVGGTGAGVWALSECEGLLEEFPSATSITAYHFVQTSKDGLELSKALSSPLNLPFPLTHTRRVAAFTASSPPGLIISPFHLSTLPTPSARAQHLASLLSLEPECLVVLDRATDEGWNAISAARAQVLAGGEWHVVAPCPHDRACPLAPNTSASASSSSMEPRKDKCRFSQRLQAPEAMRKTKHSKRGDEDLMYSYVVFRRGERPVRPSGQLTGRKGGVAREIERIERSKGLGRVELKEVRDGETLEFVQEAVTLREEDLPAEPRVDREVEAETLRAEAYHWPRLVLPPLKRTGHVVMDTCHPIGEIVRMTIPRSLSKQAYHDARKSAWGDLFPHEPKGALVLRTGKEVASEEEMGMEMDNKGVWPVAELELADEAAKEEQEQESSAGGKEADDVFVKTFG